jgi:hypothetical protein
MLQFKEGVSFKGLQPQMLIALQVVEEEFGRMSLDTMITSGSDGEHMKGSLHGKGLALDFRTKHASGIMKGIYLGIQKRLAPIGFDILWEKPTLPEEHLHVEYDPK